MSNWWGSIEMALIEVVVVWEGTAQRDQWGFFYTVFCRRECPWWGGCGGCNLEVVYMNVDRWRALVFLETIHCILVPVLRAARCDPWAVAFSQGDARWNISFSSFWDWIYLNLSRLLEPMWWWPPWKIRHQCGIFNTMIPSTFILSLMTPLLEGFSPPGICRWLGRFERLVTWVACI